MSQKNGTAAAPKRKREAILEDLRTVNEIVRQGEAIDVPSGVKPLAEFGAGDFDAGPVPWDALTDSWLNDALHRCVKGNRPNVAKLLLWKLLYGIGVAKLKEYKTFEAAVFRPFPRIGTGRPVKEERGSIVKVWEELEKPPLSQNTLAKQFYGPIAWARADATTRKNYRNKCREAVNRAREAERKAPLT